MELTSNKFANIELIQREYNLAESRLTEVLVERCKYIMEKCSLKEHLFELICPVTHKTIHVGEYIDTVTKITDEGKYWYTSNGERSSEVIGGNLNNLPVKALLQIRSELEMKLPEPFQTQN